ncbi:hypothetical protein DFH28DRAFT_884719 [Melampsora americana]|nr:hypothetical protein DFH28DRAFT_884719 [Melampsora americana]
MISERDVPMQGIHTNNFTESYHRVLKYNFLNRHTLRRPDDTIQVLVDSAEPDFRQSTISTSLGFRPQRSTKYQNISKGLADSYSDDDLKDLGVTITQQGATKWAISSFTRPLALTYHVNTTPPKDGVIGSINNCTCSHYVKSKSACKHMYVLARQNAYRILETNPEIDDGQSLFVPRGITQPFNLVVRTMTTVHTDTPPPSPPSHPYRSSSGMAQTPSTSGLLDGTFQYAPMVPAPLPYRRPTIPPTAPAAHQSISSRQEASTPTSGATSGNSSNWLPETTHLTSGRTDPSSDSYIDRLFYDPFHVQSTPPAFNPSRPPRSLAPSGLTPYPPTPFGIPHAAANLTRRPPAFDLSSSRGSHILDQPASVSDSSRARPSPRHHPYTRPHLSAVHPIQSVPHPPPPTQANYELDFSSLQHHLQPYVTHNEYNNSIINYQPVRTPEVTPAPVTTSQLDGLFRDMENAQSRLPRTPPPPVSSSRNYGTHPTDDSGGTNSPSHLPHSTTDQATASTSSQPMEATTTNQSLMIDHGPSTLTELEVEAMNEAELQFYKKKDDLTELFKTLRQINMEAPFADEAGLLNRLSPQLIAAMRQRAAQFLTTLRVFNSTNRTSKQRR